MGYHHKSGPEKKGKLKAMRAKGVKGQNTLQQHGFQGRIQEFPKRGG